MSSNLNLAVETLLFAAVEIPDARQRQEYLDQACGENQVLRQELEQLVADYFRAGAFLERPDDSRQATLPLVEQERIGGMIGRYKLLEQIGEGGMGVVFLAEQTEPVRRKVALKIVKPGLDSHQVIARFEAERQALATMDHGHIARVLDGGATTGGRPYFVMELVRGLPITDFCDQKKLTQRQRLEMMVSVCQAVHHAHQKGIIHRDLKPSNVLVTMQDGSPVAKVIDFGIAKATHQPLTAMTVHTAFAQLVGTPLYMSPEQAELTSQDVDTRSDVYSLGVLTYELLTGHTPFDKEVLGSAGLDELRRIIREEEPQRPSARVSTLDGQLISTLSRQRGIDERQFSKSLRGELDWMILKALEKDRTRRYESASAMADDLRRYLNDEPVLACPPSLAYRVKKFARRNKTLLTTCGLIAVALVVGTAVSLWQAIEANAARELADTRLSGEIEQRQKAQRNLGLALDAVNDMYDELGTTWLAGDVSASNTQIHFLQKAVDFYGQVAADVVGNDLSLAETAELYRRKALLHSKLLQYDEAGSSIATAVDLLNQAVATNPADLKQRLALANVHNLAGALHGKQGDAEAAIKYYAAAVAEYQVVAAAQPDEPQHQLMLARIQQNWGLACSIHGDRPAAERLVRQASESYESLGQARLKELGEFENYQLTRIALARLLVGGGKASEAEALARTALADCEVRMRNLTDNRPLRTIHGYLLGELSHALIAQDRDSEAEPLLRHKLSTQVDLLAIKRDPYTYVGDMWHRGVRGQDQPEAWNEWVMTTVVLARVQRRLGQSQLAELQLGKAAVVAGFLQALRPKEMRYHVTLANTYAETALLLRDRYPEEANQHLEVAAAVWRKLLTDFDASRVRTFTSDAHSSEGDYAWFCATFPNFDVTSPGSSPPPDGEAKIRQGLVPGKRAAAINAVRHEKWADAATTLESLIRVRQGNGALDPLLVVPVLVRLGRIDEARRWFEEADRWMRAQDPQDDELERLRDDARKSLSTVEIP